jgi:DmsE family decaheme c-type cytochrome
MNGKIRNALDARAIPAADRKMGRRPSPESGSSKGPIALFLSGVIFAALLGLAQPGAAGQSASVADDYSVLRDFVQSKDAAEPTPVAAEQSNPPGDAYHSALRASAQAGAAGQSASATDDYAALRDFAQSKDAAAPSLAVADAAQSPAKPVAEDGAYSALLDYDHTIAAAEPNLVVAQAASPAAKPAKIKKPGPVADEGGYAKGDPQTCLGCHGQDAHIVAFLKASPMAVKGDPKTPMAQGGCESCHGPSAAHVASRSKGGDGEPGVVFKGPNASPVADRNAVCQGCHEGGMLINWQGSAMERAGVACADCHTVHAAEDPVRVKKTQAEVCFACHAEQRADSFKYSHHPIREGKVVCSDCHSPMGSPTEHLLKEFSVNETCYNCHADKRGPMLWEHQPVREDCTNCHTPHGSSEVRLMKENMGFMCSSCHSSVAAGHSGGAFGGGHTLPGGNLLGSFNSALGNQRLCLNCHSQIHGSNSPNGAYFIR